VADKRYSLGRAVATPLLYHGRLRCECPTPHSCRCSRFCSVELLQPDGVVSSCSNQTELEDAKLRIAQLEAELAAERAKAPTRSVTPTPVVPVIAPTPATPVIAPTSAQPELGLEKIGHQWVYDSREDKMTGGTTRHAYVLSTNSVNFGSPYAGQQYGRLVPAIWQTRASD